MEILSVEEVAVRLSVSPRVVRFWCAEGHLKAKRVGRDWAILDSDLEGFEKPRRGPKVRRYSIQWEDENGRPLGLPYSTGGAEPLALNHAKAVAEERFNHIEEPGTTLHEFRFSWVEQLGGDMIANAKPGVVCRLRPY